jgi:3-hydroxyacyl-CoA dehydrogenase/enoyl-CoA hydratase/3-hydroxybutyryl-CoA epimerase
MNLKNFRFEDRRRRHRARDLGHARPSMNVIDVECDDELEAIVDKVAADAAIKGCVITSGKDAFSGGADLTMLEAPRPTYRQGCSRAKGEEKAMKAFFERAARCRSSIASSRPAASRSSRRSTALPRRRVRTGARLPLSRRSDNPTRPRRPAGGQGRPVPRRRRHAARGALMQTGDALQMLFKGDQIKAEGARHEPVARGRAAGQADRSAKAWIKAAARASRRGTRRASSCPPTRCIRRPA